SWSCSSWSFRSWSFSSLGGILHWHERVRVSWVHEVRLLQLLLLHQLLLILWRKHRGTGYICFGSLGGILHWHERVRVSRVHEVRLLQLLLLHQLLLLLILWRKLRGSG